MAQLVKHLETYNAGDLGSIPELGRSPGEGNGNPLQYSCLEIPWMEEPGRLQSMESQRVRHDWATSLPFTFFWLTIEQNLGYYKVSLLKARKSYSKSHAQYLVGLDRKRTSNNYRLEKWIVLHEESLPNWGNQKNPLWGMVVAVAVKGERSGWNHGYLVSFTYSSVTQLCPTLCDPMNQSTPGLPVHHQLPESTQTHVHWVSDAIQPSHPLSSHYPALSLS